MHASSLMQRGAGMKPCRAWHARRPFSAPSRPSGSNSTYTTRSSPAETILTADLGLVFPLGEAGAWDDAAVGNPVVRCFVGDNEQRWFMWYSGRTEGGHELDALTPASGKIGVAFSRDGLNWSRGTAQLSGDRGADGQEDVGIILEANADWWTMDTCHMTVADVQVLSNSSVSSGVGVYWMFYSGGDFEAIAAPEGLPGLAAGQEYEGVRMRAGLAMSQDGRHWARIEGDHHTGAVLDVGEAGQWDELFIGGPQVLAAGPRDMRMYYHSWDKARGKYIVGLATSPDGFRWTKQGPIFEGSAAPGAYDSLGALECQVVRDVDTKQFLMFYEAVAEDNTRSIGLATSQDGISGWKRLDVPVLQASEGAGAWDSGAVGAPCAVSMSAGRWRLYYSGKGGKEGPWSGVGLALSVVDAVRDGVPLQFKRRSGVKAAQ